METLILAPFWRVALACARRSNARIWPVIVIDGLDECGVEEVHDTTTGATRASKQDQLEILQVLLQAASDLTFPFRILIASRPESAFREFFDAETHPAAFVQKLDLHEDNNADADVTLFLGAHLSRIRRRYNLPSSSGAIKTLVMNALGQFIYGATVIRVLGAVDREALLAAILKVGVQDASGYSLLGNSEILSIFCSHQKSVRLRSQFNNIFLTLYGILPAPWYRCCWELIIHTISEIEFFSRYSHLAHSLRLRSLPCSELLPPGIGLTRYKPRDAHIGVFLPFSYTSTTYIRRVPGFSRFRFLYLMANVGSNFSGTVSLRTTFLARADIWGSPPFRSLPLSEL
jgi:hypothetical protein